MLLKLSELFPDFDFLGANHSGYLISTKIEEALKLGKSITIDFNGFRLITHGVAYNMFANILDNYTLEDIKKHVKLENANNTIKNMINLMIKVKVNENRV